MGVVIGRDDELSTLLALVDRLPGSGPAVATVVAAAGMGKSALAVAFRDALLERDVTLLTSRPLEAEARLSFSTLGDLFDPLPPEQYDGLPTPQRAAIRSALLLDDGDGADPRAVALAVRGVLRDLAAEQPVVVLVDDAQWIDDASAAALAQSLPRLTDQPVLVVVWARPSGRPPGDWLPDWPRTELGLAPLPISAIFHVVRHHLDVTLSRSELRAVGEASGGNPLHALEFARHRALGPGASFEGLLTERVLALPRPTRRALLATALCAAPTATRLAEAVGRSVEELLDDLEPAVAGQLIRVGGNITFLHPLYLEAVVGCAAPEERVAFHRLLAEVEPLAEARIRHRALADESPDESLATALVEAAGQAWARAAWDSATDLLRLAVDRSADPANRDERLVALAERFETNGNLAEAEQVLLPLRERPEGPSYWAATVELCSVLTALERYDEARVLAQELDAAELAPIEYARAAVSAEIDMLLGREEEGDARMEEALRRLADVPDQPGLSRLKSDLLVILAYRRYHAAEPFEDLLEQAIAHDLREPGERMLFRPVMLQAVHLMSSSRFEAAREVLDEILTTAVESGDDISLSVIQSYRASLALRSCRFEEARQIAEEGLAVARVATPSGVPTLTNFLIAVHAHTGEVDRALELSQQILDSGAIDDPWQEALWSVGRLGALMEAGRHEEACVLADRARALGEELEWRHPADPMIHPNILDALVATGRLDDAEAYLADVRARATAINLFATLAELERHDVTLLAARGDLDGAIARIPAMLAALDDLPDGMVAQPVERARSWWAAGRAYRRGRMRTKAAESFREAAAIFDALGCVARAARVRADLERTGGQRSKEVLTQAELAVARAAAAGRRNAEIAEELFLSVKTVESLLTRCYRKLDIRSRVDLGAALERVTTGG